ncbi:MAG: TonB-dependent receptor [Proteobacteria bacterium]|nr:TonB-dependent receptor [Pseudomonadota bacterium]MYJ94753.1 TonB-dependent receptor [Pseudomonadota bacterium]
MRVTRGVFGVIGFVAGALVFSQGEEARAQQSASAQAMLEEVVVTARRREESLQDLPLSVAAITADAMQAQGIYDIMDITDHVPNVNFTNTGRRGVTALYIRGIGNDTPLSLAPVGAGVYIDGHYLPNTVGNMLNTVDIERIEVLRGPQGTLFGKNTTGGAINIVSAKPAAEFEASALARLGGFGQADFRGMVNIPLSDIAAARFSYSKETSDGFYYNRTLNSDWGATDLNAITAALRLTPDDNWTVDLGFRGNYQDDHNAPGQCRARPTQGQVDNLAKEITVNGVVVRPAQIYNGPVYENGVGQWGGTYRFGRPSNGDVVLVNGVPVEEGPPNQYRVNSGGHVERLYPGAVLDYWEACNTDNAMGDFVTSSEKASMLELDNTNFNATIQWDSAGEIGGLDNLNIKVIASTHETDYNYYQDRDYSSVQIDAIGTPPFPGPGTVRETAGFEFLVTAAANERVDFVVGAHLFDDETFAGQGDCLRKTLANFAALSDPTSGAAITCMPDGGTQFDWLSSPRVFSGPGPFPAGMSGYIGTESSAVFGHVTIDLTDAWTLDLGARYTDETRVFNLVELETVPGTCRFGGPGDPPRSGFCTPDYVLTFDSIFDAGFYNDTSADFSATTPAISLTRNLEEGMVYGTIAQGFLSGSFNDELNTTLAPELAPLLTYQPESVTNYEVGYKGALADGRVRMAVALFWMDYTDKQQQITIDNADGRYGGDPSLQVTTNAATLDIRGIELEFRATPWDGGFVSVDLGRLDSQYGEFNLPAGHEVDPGDVSTADYSPEWTINASVEHVFQMGNGATLTPQLGMYWQDDYDFDRNLGSTANSLCFTPAYAKLRARATYMPAEGNWSASVFGSNIADERYHEWCTVGNRSGAYYYRYGRPDVWGLEFNVRWE